MRFCQAIDKQEYLYPQKARSPGKKLSDYLKLSLIKNPQPFETAGGLMFGEITSFSV